MKSVTCSEKSAFREEAPGKVVKWCALWTKYPSQVAREARIC
jgi:hypothetical protein